MRFARFTSFAVATTIALCGLSAIGCSPNTENSSDGNASVKIGTMPTEDILPMWVAEKDGIFPEVEVDVEIVSFDSAQALSAAIAAGEVDMAMVDVPRAVKLCESGTSVDMEWITLGAEASQGAFGVMAASDAPYSTLSELADYIAANPDSAESAGIGVAANTVPEYVFEMLCIEEGIDPASIPTQEIASLPERYSLMASGNLAAAALPASMLELGEIRGMKVLAIDTEGENLSQSVMIARSEYADNSEETIFKVAKAWDMAVDKINSNPSEYVVILAEKANLNEEVVASYKVSEYPYAMDGVVLMHPAAILVEPQIEWMESKGYVSSNISYDEKTGKVVVE